MVEPIDLLAYKPLWVWGIFVVIILTLLLFDLGILHPKSEEMGMKQSIILSCFYIIISLLFGGWIYYLLGSQSAQEYLTAFIVEKTLSLDNIFVMSIVFSYFSIPPKYHHKVLFFGILGVILLRGIMIGAGAVLVAHFHWVLYIFAAFLMFTGFKMVRNNDAVFEIQDNPILKFIRKKFLVTETLHDGNFFVKLPDKKNPRKLRYWVTPLFVTLILIECIDIVFAVDSIPAVFAITTDPYIIYTSNIFAILGLRALYFTLCIIIYRFKYLKKSLALLLIFIGSKIFITDFLGLKQFPTSVSLGVTCLLIAAGIVYSLYRTRIDRSPPLS